MVVESVYTKGFAGTCGPTTVAALGRDQKGVCLFVCVAQYEYRFEAPLTFYQLSTEHRRNLVKRPTVLKHCICSFLSIFLAFHTLYQFLSFSCVSSLLVSALSDIFCLFFLSFFFFFFFFLSFSLSLSLSLFFFFFPDGSNHEGK